MPPTERPPGEDTRWVLSQACLSEGKKFKIALLNRLLYKWVREVEGCAATSPKITSK